MLRGQDVEFGLDAREPTADRVMRRVVLSESDLTRQTRGGQRPSRSAGIEVATRRPSVEQRASDGIPTQLIVREIRD